MPNEEPETMKVVFTDQILDQLEALPPEVQEEFRRVIELMGQVPVGADPQAFMAEHGYEINRLAPEEADALIERMENDTHRAN